MKKEGSDAAMCRLLQASCEFLQLHSPRAWQVVEKVVQEPVLIPPDANGACQLPVAGRIPDLAPLTNDKTAVLFQAVLEALPYVHWRQTYSLKDGFDQHYLDNYGWFHLVSERGPFYAQQLRLDFGYFGQGLFYRLHKHKPDEIYTLVAGQMDVILTGHEQEHCHTLKPGDYIAVPSQTLHAMNAPDAPFFVLGLQWGEDLLKKSDLLTENTS